MPVTHTIKLGRSIWSRWLLAAIVVTILPLATGCQLIAESRLRSLERDLAPVLAQSNLCGGLDAAPLPTGDSLFDRYALAVEARLNPQDPEHRELDAAIVPDEELADWEGDFGEDPRYWELRYCCASSTDFEQSADGRFIAPTDFLHEARRRGIATAGTLMLLHLERSFEYDLRFNKIASTAPDRYYGFGDLGPPDHLPVRPPLDAGLIEQSIELHRQEEAEELLLLNEAVAAGSDQAWPLYLRAMYWFELGDDQTGLADLKAGNAAPQADYPTAFPLSTVATALQADAPSGSAAVSGAVLLMATSHPQRDYTPVLNHMLNALMVAGLSGDQGQLNAWQGFACRSVGDRYAGSTPYFISLYMIRMAADYWEEEYAAVLTPEQVNVLQRVRGAMDGLRQPVADGFSRRDEAAMTELLAAVLDDRGYYLARYFSVENGARINSELLQPALNALQAVSYPELRLTAELRRYDPVTIEDARHDRREAEQRESQRRDARQAAAANK